MPSKSIRIQCRTKVRFLRHSVYTSTVIGKLPEGPSDYQCRPPTVENMVNI